MFSLQIYKDILCGEIHVNGSRMPSAQKGVFPNVKPVNLLDEKAVLHERVIHLENDVT